MDTSNTQITTTTNDCSLFDHDEYTDVEVPDIEGLLAWNYYFPIGKPVPEYHKQIDEQSNEDSDDSGDENKSQTLLMKRYNLVKLFYNPIFKFYRNKIKQPDENNCLALNYVILKNQVLNGLEFDFKLRDEPEMVLDCLGVCFYQMIYHTLSLSKHLKKKIRIKIQNFEPILPLRKLKSNLIGKFVSVKGTGIRVGNVKPLVTQMTYICSKCGEHILKFFVEGKAQLPSVCSKRGCASKIFEPDRSSAETVDWQKIKIQEEIDQRESGGAPKTVDCELTQDLCEQVVPGDVVTVSGIVKVLKAEEKGPQQKNRTVYLMYIDVNSIDSTKLKSNSNKLDSITYSLKDMYGIKEIAEQPNLFQLIVNSLCPAIYGHLMVKAGLALTLFGGTPKNTSNSHVGYESNKNKLSIRSDPHVLIVGDPGLGKSQMLKAVQVLSPRGVMVTGGMSTIAGLTVTLLKEAGSGDFALEAGALVLSDQGCCFIDEFDKMTNEHQALLEAMEQQSVSIAKAGIVCNLPARTSVIAAANPVGGSYNRAKTVSENIKMSAPILSRFDLIFILLDKPNSDLDNIISHHITELHTNSYEGNSNNNKNNKKRKHQTQQVLTQQSVYDEAGTRIPLKDRLLVGMGQDFDPIQSGIFRKYISYAKKFVQPKLSEEAAKEIQKFYLELRSKSSSSDTMPVTTRQLESLIRLSEARAKLELRELVTKEDALDIIEIVRESLFDTFEDEYGNIDFKRATGVSKSSVSNIYISILTKEAKKRNVKEFSKNEMYMILKDYKLPVDDFDHVIETLNFHGRLLKQGNSKYSIKSI